MQAAIDDLWMYTGEMFAADATERALRDGTASPATPRALAPRRGARASSAVLDEATLARAGVDAWMQRGGKQGVHTEHLGHLLAEMQFLQRGYPERSGDARSTTRIVATADASTRVWTAARRRFPIPRSR